MDHPWSINRGTILPHQTSGAQFRTSYVSELIDPTTKTWKQALVSYLFESHTITNILNTLLFPQAKTDVLNWSGERNGSYSIYNAYRICTETIRVTPLLRRSCQWNSTWKIKALPKVKDLVWRFYRSCFPTRARLNNRGMNCPVDCVICNVILTPHSGMCSRDSKGGFVLAKTM